MFKEKYLYEDAMPDAILVKSAYCDNIYPNKKNVEFNLSIKGGYPLDYEVRIYLVNKYYSNKFSFERSLVHVNKVLSHDFKREYPNLIFENIEKDNIVSNNDHSFLGVCLSYSVSGLKSELKKYLKNNENYTEEKFNITFNENYKKIVKLKMMKNKSLKIDELIKIFNECYPFAKFNFIKIRDSLLYKIFNCNEKYKLEIIALESDVDSIVRFLEKNKLI